MRLYIIWCNCNIQISSHTFIPTFSLIIVASSNINTLSLLSTISLSPISFPLAENSFFEGVYRSKFITTAERITGSFLPIAYTPLYTLLRFHR